MVSDVYNYGLRFSGHTSPHLSGSGRLVSADYPGFPPSRDSGFIFFYFSCLGKERKKVAERREIPFPSCHTPLFALYPWGPIFFLSLLFFCVSCAMDVYPESAHVGGRPRFVRAWLVYTCTRNALGSGFYFRAGRGLARTGDRDYLQWSPVWCYCAIIGAILFPSIYYYMFIYGSLNTVKLGTLQSESDASLQYAKRRYFRTGMSLSISGGADMGLCILTADLLGHLGVPYH